MGKLLSIILAAVFLAPIVANAEPVGITKDIMSITVQTKNGPVKIVRNQDNNAVINPAFAKTSRKCPPFCVQPQKVAPGVETVGELEVIKYMKNGGLIIDARTVEWHVKGTIPGSKNIPYTQVASRLNELGCKKGASWDCSNAKTVLLFCNGLWCGQSPTAIRAMLREGYPASKLLYYRNGMQGWQSLGLTVVEGEMS
ncbi:MAG: sulfurtransferase [Rhodospirillaceae bacterium TMED8]|nr:sulfurtransferase [Magnetovibrio sp.]OUT47819.1 MAG: sulfurtransferase [Rhodospirillaceae bacterium TMED8]|tara:strand:+ start:4192 stop:4785 length:594 start_codon:yes stop_codon:yes gene_type:complete